MDSLREQWLIFISTPAYFIIIGVELLLSHLHNRRLYTTKDTLANIYLMLLNSGIDLAFRIVYLAILQYFYIQSILSVHQVFFYWLILVLSEDFL